MQLDRLSRRLVRWSVALPAILAVAGVGLLLRSDEHARPAPSGGGPTTLAPHARDVLILRDGTLSGEVLREGPEHVVVRLADGSVRLISRADVVERRQVAAPRTGPPVRVRLRSGRTVDGLLLADGAEQLELRLEGGAMVTLRRCDVAGVGPR